MPAAVKRTIGSALTRMLRPGIWPVEVRLARLVDSLPEPGSAAVWRGGLDGHAYAPDGRLDRRATRRMRQELMYWGRVVRGVEPSFPGDFREVFGRWQRTRLYELAERLGLSGDFAPGEPIGGRMAAWCVERSAVEIGSGPYPAVAAARWRRAAAVDPLADGYASEGLIVPEAERVAFICAPGESVPLPGETADVVIAENCLDHVADPARVASEMARLLVPGGVAWVLVDVMDEGDELHPNAMDDAGARSLLEGAGLRVEWCDVWDGRSHPRARGQWRALLRRAG